MRSDFFRPSSIVFSVVKYLTISINCRGGEMADARDLKSRDRKVIRVQLPSPAPIK